MNTMAMLTDIMASGGRIELGFDRVDGSDSMGVYYVTVSHGQWTQPLKAVRKDAIPALVANAYAVWDEHRNNLNGEND